MDWPTIADALSVRWYEGAVTPITEDLTSGWRTLPYALIMQVRGRAGTIQFENRPDQIVPDGVAAFVPPGVRHCVNLPAPTSSWWAHFDVPLFGAIDVFTLVDVPSEFRGKTAQKIGSLCRAIVKAKSAANSFGSALHQQTLCSELASQLLQPARPNPDSQHRWSGLDRLRPVLNYMRNHLAEPVSRATLARQLSLSPQWFHRVFSDIMGEAPVVYLSRLRIEKACRLLIATELSVGEISRTVGYEDPLHFSRFFKSKMGQSPKAYRESLATSLRFG